MIGAICGDILGSTYEFGIEGRKIYLKHGLKDHFTDDSVLTCAIADWVMNYGKSGLSDEEHKLIIARKLREYTLKYPDRAYGIMYAEWIREYEKTERIPPANNSYGNGAPMRVSPVAYAFDTIKEVEHYAELQARVTHDNDEAVKGACAIAVAIKLALDQYDDKRDIKHYIEKVYGYDLSRTFEEYKVKDNEFDCSCQVTVPQALMAFLEGNSYEDVILKAISLGGDCDTVAAMAGSIAHAFYGEMREDIFNHCMSRLTKELYELCGEFQKNVVQIYYVGVYIKSKEDEKVLSGFIRDESIEEVEETYDIYDNVFRAIFITKEYYKELSKEMFGDEIPSGECILEKSGLQPSSIIVVVDADIHDDLYNVFITGDEYRLISEEKDFAYMAKKMGIEKQELDCSCDAIMEDIKRSLVEKCVCVNMMRCNRNLSVYDIDYLDGLIDEMNEAMMSEVCWDSVSERYQTADGQRFYDMNDVFRHLKNIPWNGELYKVEKINIDKESVMYTFYYNKKLQLVDYEIHEKE